MVNQLIRNFVLHFMRWWKGLAATRKIDESELPGIKRRHIWTGILGHTYVTFLVPTGIYFMAYWEELSFPNHLIGMVSWFIQITVTLQVFSWVFEKWMKSRKIPWFIFSLISRLLYLPIVFSHWFPLSSATVVMLCAASAAFASLAFPVWQSWLYDLIPEKDISWFMTKRSRCIHFFGILFAFTAGWLVHEAAPHQKGIVVRAVFALGLTLGMIDLIFHFSIPEPHPKKRRGHSRIRMAIASSFRNRKLRWWIIISSLWSFSLSIAGFFCVPYIMRDLGFKEKFFQATIMTVVMFKGSSILATFVWGRFTERFGTRKVLILCCLAHSIIPLLYLLTRFYNPVPFIAASWIIAGIVMNGMEVAVPSIKQTLTRNGRSRSMDLAVCMIANTFFGAIGILIGTLITWLAGIWYVFPVSLCARVLCTIFMLYVVVSIDIGHNGNGKGAPPEIRDPQRTGI